MKTEVGESEASNVRQKRNEIVKEIGPTRKYGLRATSSRRCSMKEAGKEELPRVELMFLDRSCKPVKVRECGWNFFSSPNASDKNVRVSEN